MARFLALAVPLVTLLLAAGGFLQEVLHLEGSVGPLARLGLLRADAGGAALLGQWLLEALALTTLFLLVQGRCRRWWLDGLVTGGIAWIFRGPLLLLTLSRLTRLPAEPWTTRVQGWLATYLVCGLALGALGTRWGSGPLLAEPGSAPREDGGEGTG